MIIEKAINIRLEEKEIETLDKASGIIEYLMGVLEETGNISIVEFYGMSDIFNKLEEIISDFSKNYPIEAKTL